jgi:hypothetical protein
MNTSSVNIRHDQEVRGSDVFITPPSKPEGAVEVICSSSRRRMDHAARYTTYSLLSHTLKLNDRVIESWPARTHIHCWNCCHTFTSVPISIPRSTQVINTKTYYEVYGVFCSLNCAKKFLLEKDTHDKQQLLMQLNDLCVHVFDMAPQDVFNAKEAPPRIFLKMFGGHLDIDEYRTKSLKTRCLLVTPPFVSHAMLLEEHSGAKETVMDVVEPLREGQHVVRGLRRPTLPVTVANSDPDVAPPTSRFNVFLKSKQRAAPKSSAEVRTPKKARKCNDIATSGGGLGMFLK